MAMRIRQFDVEDPRSRPGDKRLAGIVEFGNRQQTSRRRSSGGAVKVVSTLFWLLVFWFIASVVADKVGLDTRRPAVFVGAIAVGTVVALWLTWGGGKKQS